MISLLRSTFTSARRRIRLPARYGIYALVMVIFVVTGKLSVHNPENAATRFKSGDLIQANGDPKVYVIDGGNQKRHITSRELFVACGYRNEEIQMVSNDLLSQIPTGNPVRIPQECWVRFKPGDIIQGQGQGTGSGPVFIIDNENRKRLIASPAIFSACGYASEEIQTVSNPLLTRIPSAPDITTPDQCWIKVNPGDLVRGKESSVTFVVDDSFKRRRIASQDLFISCGYRSEDVKILPDKLIENLAGGPDITNRCSSEP